MPHKNQGRNITIRDSILRVAGDLVFGNLTRIYKISVTLFGTTGSVVAFGSIIFLAVGAIIFVSWWQSQPAIMPKNEFNIAVATFVAVPKSADPAVAEAASQMVFSFVDAEYRSSGLEKVNVAHEHIGAIHDYAEAERLANRINATVVIYGDVIVVGDQAALEPKFYVSDPFEPNVSEISGQHQLSLPVKFDTREILNFQSGVNEALRLKSSVLIDFTKGLAYLSNEDLQPALDSFEAAIASANSYGDFEGKEVLYLFASHVARKLKNYQLAQQYIDQALKINHAYARAYIGQANIYYSQLDFNLALKYYTDAMQIEDPPENALIPEKANLGIGNVKTFLFQSAESPEKAKFSKSQIEVRYGSG